MRRFLFLIGVFASLSLFAGEDLFGHLKLAEPLPKGAWELYQIVANRSDKGTGTYEAYNYEWEVEYGVTNRFTLSGGLAGQGLDTSGLLVDGYLPGDNEYSFKLSGAELKMAYNFLAPAKDGVGLSMFLGVEKTWLDPHSGFDKDSLSLSTGVNLQKYFLEGQLIWAGSIGVESTKATRGELEGLPEDFEWPTFAEVELEWTGRTGLSYRFVPKWFVSLEAEFQQEYETEVNLERESLFMGPSVHYGGKKFWLTLSYLGQVRGSGETYEGQPDGYHLIEKTKREIILKVGFNF
ncbi:MAG: hypothetical protein H6510_02460 [Acidobacteria bacterium]|nr:hypothetical protein [Acidobacteriota bacterium]MCB9396657.1 hypothetical protein [Acidobacteriota bacterium]